MGLLQKAASNEDAEAAAAVAAAIAASGSASSSLLSAKGEPARAPVVSVGGQCTVCMCRYYELCYCRHHCSSKCPAVCNASRFCARLHEYSATL
jgi:hypothetical protein